MKQISIVPAAAAHSYSRAFRRASLLSTCVFVALSMLSPAAEPIPLDTLVDETVAGNPELKFYQAEIAAARGGGSPPVKCPILS